MTSPAPTTIWVSMGSSAPAFSNSGVNCGTTTVSSTTIESPAMTSRMTGYTRADLTCSTSFSAFSR